MDRTRIFRRRDRSLPANLGQAGRADLDGRTWSARAAYDARPAWGTPFGLFTYDVRYTDELRQGCSSRCALDLPTGGKSTFLSACKQPRCLPWPVAFFDTGARLRENLTDPVEFPR